MKANLTQREKRALIGAGVAILGLIIYFNVEGVMDKYSGLKHKIEGERLELKKISHLRDQYLHTHQQLQAVKSSLEKRRKGFSVLSFIEDLANKENIRENITSVKPKKISLGEEFEENMVEIKMDDVTLAKLVDFIFKIETSGHLLKVKRLRIKTRYDDRNLLHVTLQVTTFTGKA